MEQQTTNPSANGQAVQQNKENEALVPIKRFNLTLCNGKTQEYLSQVLASKKDAFVNNITALVANDTKLQECQPMSLIYAGIKATALDLPLDNNLGFAYIIPYKNNKTGKTEAQLQLGYRAFVQLAERSGQYVRINVGKVYEGMISNIDVLSGDIELKGKKTSDKVIGYFAFFRLQNGFEKVKYMTIEEVEAHAKRYSQTYSSKYDSTRNASKWSTDFDAMAEKTVLKLLLSKYGPLSTQMTGAIKADQAVVNESGSYDYADAPEEQAQPEQTPTERIQALKDKKESTAPTLL